MGSGWGRPLVGVARDSDRPASESTLATRTNLARAASTDERSSEPTGSKLKRMLAGASLELGADWSGHAWTLRAASGSAGSRSASDALSRALRASSQASRRRCQVSSASSSSSLAASASASLASCGFRSQRARGCAWAWAGPHVCPQASGGLRGKLERAKPIVGRARLLRLESDELERSVWVTWSLVDEGGDEAPDELDERADSIESSWRRRGSGAARGRGAGATKPTRASRACELAAPLVSLGLSDITLVLGC